MFGEVYQFQHFWSRIFHQDAVSEYVDISYTKTFYHITAHKGPGEEWRYNFTLSLTSAPDEDACPTPCLGRFTRRKDPVPIVQKAGLVSGPALMDV